MDMKTIRFTPVEWGPPGWRVDCTGDPLYSWMCLRTTQTAVILATGDFPREGLPFALRITPDPTSPLGLRTHDGGSMRMFCDGMTREVTIPHDDVRTLGLEPGRYTVEAFGQAVNEPETANV